MSVDPTNPLLPLILCGGSGTRLWPLSRESYPKQFHRFVGSYTLFEDTVLRATALPNVTEIAIVCNEAHRFMAAEQAARVWSGKVHIVLEPAARNTAPAIAVVAHLLPHRTLVVMPSDHYMPSPDTFVACVGTALPATEAGYLVTFGITPTAPETGYGYIAAGQALQGLQGNHDVRHVDKFLEKPNLEVAKTLVATGTHTWNSGMFVMCAADFLAELQIYAPEVFAATQLAAKEAKHETDFVRLDKATFESSPSISVDYAVFERTSRAAVTPFKGEWSDLGSWSAVADLAKNQHKVQRPWGWYDSLDLDSNHQVKRIMVKPGASISLQTHEHRAEHWIITKGEAQITLGHGDHLKVKTYHRYDHVFIPKHTKHRLQNMSPADVELIEVQCGDYFGEDDIIRYEDIYGRVIASEQSL